MFFEISKFLYVFVTSPISWLIILLVIGYLFRKRKAVKLSCWISALVLFLLMGNGSIYEYVRYNAFKQYNKAELKKGHYKVAIVMGGFSGINKETGQLNYVEGRADRLWEAVRLYKNKKVDNILITGDGSTMIDGNGECTADLFLQYMSSLGVPDSVFILEQKARNTRQNAVNSVKMLNNMHISDKDCLLVTSVEHIGRSLKCFAKEGFYPDWYAVSLYSKPSSFSHRSLYPDWGVMVKWQRLFNEWIGNMTYRIMGYI